MKKAVKKNYFGIHLITITSFILISLQIKIYRSTFIHWIIPFTVMIIGGFTLFMTLRKRIKMYKELPYHFSMKAIHGTFMFGGIIMYIFMAINYYLNDFEHKTMLFEVKKKGHLAKTRKSCAEPYVIIEYNQTDKQIVYPCNKNIDNMDTVKFSISKGFFGYDIIHKKL